MHLPYSNMGRKALAYLLRHEWRSLPRWKAILDEVGMEEPVPKDPRGTIESVLADREFMQNDQIFQRLFTRTGAFRDVYRSKLASSLIASTMVGNLYTASLYLGFRSTLEVEHRNGADLGGKRFGFGSYGSGSSAMIFSGVIGEDYRQVVKSMDMEAEMGQRRRLTINEYEALHENRRGFAESILNPTKEFVLVDVKTGSESRGERRYIFND